MGVSGFAPFLKRRYPEAYRYLSQEEQCIDHLYIDIASTLHQSVRKARKRSYFHYLLHKRLDAILAVCKPRKRVVIALDGPAPLAKLLEQRRRRRREADRVSRSPLSDSATLTPSQLGVSSLMLTTGTPLMLEVHQSLAYYICKKLGDPRTEHLEFELSDSTVKGEGELKILSKILEQGLGEEGEYSPESHMILGADSDLLIMAMVSGRRSLYICDDSQDFEQLAAAEGQQLGGGEGGGTVAVAPWPSPSSSDPPPQNDALNGSGARSASGGSPSSGAAREGGGAGPTTRSGQWASAGRGRGRWREGGAGGDPQDPPPGLKVFCRDALERSWAQRHLEALGSRGEGGGEGVEGEGLRREVTGMALDLALLAIMCGGNDYLPGLQGAQLMCKHRPGLWPLYLEMRAEEGGAWRGQHLVLHDGTTARRSARIHADMLAELLRRYEGRRAQLLPLEPSTDEDLTPSSDQDADPDFDLGEEGELEGVRGDTLAGAQRLRQVRHALRALAHLPPSLLQPPTLQLDLHQVDAVVADLAAPAAAAGEGDGGATAAAAGELGGEAEASARRRLGAHNRAEADAVEYIKGLEWVLQMYTRGQVEDYRWTYDMTAPGLDDLLTALGAAGGAAAAEAAARGGAALPLLPAACAMALLPGGGRAHAPTALRHLMDPGSPLADIYATCPQCSNLARQMGAASKELHRTRLELGEVRRVYRKVWLALGGKAGAAAAAATPPAGQQQQPSSPRMQQLREAAAQLEASIEGRQEVEGQLREAMGALSRAQQDHFAAKHPYKPFPTADLEAAVASIPVYEHPWFERRLLRFGRELLFRKEAGGGDQAGQESRSAAEGAAAQGGARGEQLSAAAEKGLQGESAAAAATAAGSATQGAPSITPWLRECTAFAARYGRYLDRSSVPGQQLLMQGIQREILPLSRPLTPHRQQGAVLSRHSRPSGVGGSAAGVGPPTPPGATPSLAPAQHMPGSTALLRPSQPPPRLRRAPPRPRTSAAPAALRHPGGGQQVRTCHSGGSVPTPRVGSGCAGPACATPPAAGPRGSATQQQLLRHCSRLLPAAARAHRLISCLRRF